MEKTNDMKKSVIISYIAFAVLVAVNLMFFIAFAGEDNPDNPMPLSRLIAIKCLAAAGLYACFMVGKWMRRNGLIPDSVADLCKED